MDKILVVDDNNEWRKILVYHLKEKGYYVNDAEDGTSAIKSVESETYDLVLTDLQMGDVDGIEVIKRVKELNATTEVILITGFASVDTAVEAMRAGAYDYITKQTEAKEIMLLIEKALERKKMSDTIRAYERELKEKYKFDEIIGKSKPMMAVLTTVSKVCGTDSTVLVMGPSGTGKELIGRAIHFNSTRSTRPFIIVNCGAIPETLQESELFGHKKGSFTGAFEDQKGLIEEADGGTLILDEVGELSLSAQVKLLRFLQDNEVRRVGESTNRIVDVRVIAMTNRNLKEDVKNQEFREDLYFRLNVVPINIPPLKDRGEDIELLINHFLERCRTKLHKPKLEITRRAMNKMNNYTWPGNVRELENLLERCAILCDDDRITPDDLPVELDSSRKSPAGPISDELIPIAEMEKNLIIKALTKFSGNRSHSAQALGINRATLINKIKNYDLDL